MDWLPAGAVLRVFASGPLAMLRVALYAVSGLLGALLSPIGLVVTALAGVALVVWKYWQPITAFLGGVVEDSKRRQVPSVQRSNLLSPCSSGLATKCRRSGAGLLIC
ncbi:TP901 family phage tail tape measure protein [Escherichia coli]|nr:TP901 family phage tail tape measure protein [Escherichia coli]